MTSVGEVMRRHKGFGPGFDLLRLVLSLLVLLVHCSLLGVAEGPLGRFEWALDFAVLPLFFALSGFLVAGSLQRLSLTGFLINRAARIVPGLLVAIGLSALVLGPLLTSWGLLQYFSDPAVPRYFLNAIGSVHVALPGLFEGNPLPGVVNGSLWTIPHEMSCYLILAGLALMGIFRRPALVLSLSLALFGAAILIWAAEAGGLALPHREAIAYAFMTRGAARLVPVFLLGTAAYLYRDRIPHSPVLFAGVLAASFAIALFGQPAWAENPLVWLLTAPLVVYAVVFIGLSRFHLRVLGRTDLSYGIYLYGFPIQQSLVLLVPGLRNMAAFFLVSAALSGLMAALSWHLVERPALGLRRRFALKPRPETRSAPESAEPAAQPYAAAA